MASIQEQTAESRQKRFAQTSEEKTEDKCRKYNKGKQKMCEYSAGILKGEQTEQ
jgi:hypothetical protein